MLWLSCMAASFKDSSTATCITTQWCTETWGQQVFAQQHLIRSAGDRSTTRGKIKATAHKQTNKKNVWFCSNKPNSLCPMFVTSVQQLCEDAINSPAAGWKKKISQSIGRSGKVAAKAEWCVKVATIKGRPELGQGGGKKCKTHFVINIWFQNRDGTRCNNTCTSNTWIVSRTAQTGSNTTGQRKTVHSPDRIKWRLLLNTLCIQSAATRFQSASPFRVVTFPGHRPSSHIDTNPGRRSEKLLCPLTHSEDGEWQATSGRSHHEFQGCRHRRRGLRHLFSLSWSDRAAPSLWNRSEFFTEHHLDVRTGSGGERSDVAAAFFFLWPRDKICRNSTFGLLIAMEIHSDVWNGMKWRRGGILKSKKVIFPVRKKFSQFSPPQKMCQLILFSSIKFLYFLCISPVCISVFFNACIWIWF